MRATQIFFGYVRFDLDAKSLELALRHMQRRDRNDRVGRAVRQQDGWLRKVTMC